MPGPGRSGSDRRRPAQGRSRSPAAPPGRASDSAASAPPRRPERGRRCRRCWPASSPRRRSAARRTLRRHTWGSRCDATSTGEGNAGVDQTVPSRLRQSRHACGWTHILCRVDVRFCGDGGGDGRTTSLACALCECKQPRAWMSAHAPTSGRDCWEPLGAEPGGRFSSSEPRSLSSCSSSGVRNLTMSTGSRSARTTGQSSVCSRGDDAQAAGRPLERGLTFPSNGAKAALPPPCRSRHARREGCNRQLYVSPSTRVAAGSCLEGLRASPRRSSC